MVVWLVGLFLFGFSREACSYARMQRVGGQPTQSASPHFTIPKVRSAVPSPLRCLASIYYYVHFVSRNDVFACVCVPRIVVSMCMPYSKPCVCNVVSRLVETRLPRALRLQYFQSPPSIQLSCVLACPRAPRAWNVFPDFRCSLSVTMPSTRFLCGHVV
jgi:hypothetical protein